jgi:hypothetical protein
MIITLIILSVGLVIAVILLIRSSNRASQILPVLGWVGSLLILCSYIFLSWIKFGPLYTIEINADWIASKIEIVDAIKQIPGFDELFNEIHTLSGNDIIQAIDHPAREKVLEFSQDGRLINGFNLMTLIRAVNPPVVLLLGLGVLIALVGSIINLSRLITSRHDVQTLSRVFAVVVIFLFLALTTIFTTFDTLCSVDDFNVRLLTTLAETQISHGVWCALLGFALLAISEITDLVPSMNLTKNTSQDDTFEDFA